MKAGRSAGIILLALGLILLLAYFLVATNWDRLPKILVAGPALAVLGVTMILFPGGEFYRKDLTETSSPAKALLKAAPLTHKLMWGIGLGAGLVGSFMMLM